MLVSPGIVNGERAMRHAAVNRPLGVFAREKTIDEARCK